MANPTRPLTAHCAYRFAAPGCCSGFPPAFHVPFHSTSIIAPPPCQSRPFLFNLVQSCLVLPSLLPVFPLPSSWLPPSPNLISPSPLARLLTPISHFQFPPSSTVHCYIPALPLFFYCYCYRYCYCHRYRCRYQDRWPLIVLNYTVLVPHQLDPRQLRQHPPYIETTNYAIFTMTDAELDRDWVPNGRRPLSYVFSYPLLWSMPLLPKLNWHGGV